MHRPERQTQAKRRPLSVLGRLLLVVSLWQAPVPVLHAHGADIPDAAESAALAAHLAEFHADVPVNSHVDFGWHWHLVLLGDPLMDEPCDSDNRPDRTPAFDPFVAPQAESAPVAVLTVEWRLSGDLRIARMGALDRDHRPAAPSQFLDTYLDSVSLGTLLRVARC